VIPNGVSEACGGPSLGRRGHGLVAVPWSQGFSRGQRVVAELGQDVAGLPEDLAGP
jgi:hypothetical protein